MRPSHSFRLLAAALLGVALPAVAPLGAQGAGSRAGTGARKPITQDTYDIWRTIQGATLSPDGQWAGYTQSPVVGDGELVARATRGATEYRVARGYTGRPTNSVAANAAFTAPPAQITADSRWAVALSAGSSRYAMNRPDSLASWNDFTRGTRVTWPSASDTSASDARGICAGFFFARRACSTSACGA